jgi:YaiO family outer membrane protein
VLIKESPNDPDMRLLRGLSYSRNHQWAEAIEDLKTAAAMSPNYADVWLALGNVYRWTDHPKEAREAYARLAVLDPSAPELMYLNEKEQAQPASSLGYDWALSESIDRSVNGFGGATENTLSLRRYTEWGSIALQMLDLQEFGETDHAWVVDAYPRLWQGAYANLRYQQALGAVLYPGVSWRAELYQGMGNGWELSASHDELGFSAPVKINGWGVAKYWSDYYVRVRYQTVQSDSSSGNGLRVVGRYYYHGNADDYLEANVSAGRSDDFEGALITPSRSNSRGVAWSSFVNREWGFKVSCGFSNDNSSAAGLERSLGASLIYRW